MDKPKFLVTIGIDEVGRGPLAGPVAVGVFVLRPPKNRKGLEKIFRKTFRGVKESKQLSEQAREKWFAVIENARDRGFVDFSVAFQNARNIDSLGLTKTINRAMRNALGKALGKNTSAKNALMKNTLVLLDGGLRAPAHFKNQKTIVRGDEKKTVIALASICAKVLRDRRMCAFAKKYPHYGFDIHKGYGTRAHYAAIKKHGLSPIHRRSFLKNFKPVF